MCGIFGFVATSQSTASYAHFRAALDDQFRLADSRGKEAAGWAAMAQDRITVLKEPLSGRQLIRTDRHQQTLRDALGHGPTGLIKPLGFIGHSRLVTDGSEQSNANNQPVQRESVVGVHNGIIVNAKQLWQKAEPDQPHSEVDTEALLYWIHRHLDQNQTPPEAVRKAFALVEGAASVALLVKGRDELLLATNTGSLYLCRSADHQLMLFASERHIINQLMAGAAGRLIEQPIVEQLHAGQGCVLHLDGSEPARFDIPLPTANLPTASPRPLVRMAEDPLDARLQNLRRCTRCVLPETFPFISFDSDGVCNVCREYQPMQTHGLEALREAVAPYRRKDGGPDCVVAFSGGRDSSYALHHLKRELDLNPIAFTYDWGMVTDLARRNQARICGRLGIEHILISADIPKKRANVRKNIQAWLRRPTLGMIPLFMAGDKQFFHYANKLQKQTGAPMMVFAVNPLEKTGFKTGFCGVNEKGGGMYFDFGVFKKIQLSLYYLKQYALNPGYWNASLVDTAWAYASAFLIRHDYLMFFDYIRWDEQTIEEVLLEEYNWETATDTDSTWRIGDGTAAFYNHIYHQVAGFTENDTFRSHQIREGVLSRDEALQRVERDNRPRWDSMRWYAKTIGFDLDQALKVIQKMPRLDGQGLPAA